MKKLILLFVVLTCAISFGQKQSNNIFQIKKTYSFSNLKYFGSYSISLDFKNIKPNNFSIYNSFTGLNDTYTISQNTLIYSQSTLNSLNITREMKIDSFNPYGTKNIGFALVGGIFNLFTKNNY